MFELIFPFVVNMIVFDWLALGPLISTVNKFNALGLLCNPKKKYLFKRFFFPQNYSNVSETQRTNRALMAATHFFHHQSSETIIPNSTSSTALGHEIEPPKQAGNDDDDETLCIPGSRLVRTGFVHSACPGFY